MEYKLPVASIELDCYPSYLNAMVVGHSYRLETYALPLRDGLFPGLRMERQFIKRLCVEGIELVELQRANGGRHVMAAAGIEHISPLGRANLEPDTLRQPPSAARMGKGNVTLQASASTRSI